VTSFCNARHLAAFADRFPMLEAMAAWSIAVWFKSKRRVSRRLHTLSVCLAQGTLARLNIIIW
jgi:hypothetical protein